MKRLIITPLNPEEILNRIVNAIQYEIEKVFNYGKFKV